MFRRPRPVLTRAGIAGGLLALAGILAFLGYAHEADAISGFVQTFASIGIGVAAVGAPVVAAHSAQKEVTPTSDPRSNNGVPLTEVASPVQERHEAMLASLVQNGTLPVASAEPIPIIAVEAGHGLDHLDDDTDLPDPSVLGE